MHPNQLIAQRQRRLAPVANIDVADVFDLLPGSQRLDRFEALQPPSHQSVYTPTEPPAMFMNQALSADGCCRAVLDEAALRCALGGGAPFATTIDSSPAHLHSAMIAPSARKTGELAATGAPGRRCDGDRGRHASEPGHVFAAREPEGWRRLSDLLGGGLGMSGHRGVARCRARSVHGERQRQAITAACVARQPPKQVGWPRRRLLHDLLCASCRPSRTRSGLAKPARLRSRPATPDGARFSSAARSRSTGCSARPRPKSIPKALYRARRHVEPDAGTLDAGLGLSHLRCKTPALAIKERWVQLLACTSIRLLMAQARPARRSNPASTRLQPRSGS
jgi:hypothetical protein